MGYRVGDKVRVVRFSSPEESEIGFSNIMNLFEERVGLVGVVSSSRTNGGSYSVRFDQLGSDINFWFKEVNLITADVRKIKAREYLLIKGGKVYGQCDTKA